MTEKVEDEWVCWLSAPVLLSYNTHLRDLRDLQLLDCHNLDSTEIDKQAEEKMSEGDSKL